MRRLLGRLSNHHVVPIFGLAEKRTFFVDDRFADFSRVAVGGGLEDREELRADVAADSGSVFLVRGIAGMSAGESSGKFPGSRGEFTEHRECRRE